MIKTLPHSTASEMYVIQAAVSDPGIIQDVPIDLRSHYFYHEEHKYIWEALQSLLTSSVTIDTVSIKNHCQKAGKSLNEIKAIINALNRAQDSAFGKSNCNYHFAIIAENYKRRELLALANRLTDMASSPTEDIFDVMAKHSKSLTEIEQAGEIKRIHDAHHVYAKAIERLQYIAEKGSTITGVPSGFKAIDAMTNGWQDTELIILAARPGMGKTALALNMAINAALCGFASAIFSLEMGEVELMNRFISSQSGVKGNKIKSGQLTEHQWKMIHKAGGIIENLPIYIDDTASLSITEAQMKLRRLKREKDIKIAFFDYLQLMSGEKKGNREQEIGSISRGLKQVAKELDIPIIALSQLSRAVETRGGDKKPMLSDLRESGSIEQDANIVAFLYRAEYYGMETYNDGSTTEGKAELIIAKQRNGSTGEVPLDFNGALSLFKDEEPKYGRTSAIADPDEFTESQSPFPF